MKSGVRLRHQRLFGEVFFSSIDVDQSCCSSSSVVTPGPAGFIICDEAVPVVELVFQMSAPIIAARATAVTMDRFRIHQSWSEEDESLEEACHVVLGIIVEAVVERPALAAAVLLKFETSVTLPVLEARVSATDCAATEVSNVI